MTTLLYDNLMQRARSALAAAVELVEVTVHLASTLVGTALATVISFAAIPVLAHAVSLLLIALLGAPAWVFAVCLLFIN